MSWTLSSVSNLKLWLDAQTGVTSSGGYASAWTDQSSTGATVAQATSASRPAYSATGWADRLPCLDFDGSNDYFTVTGLTSSASEYTFFIVAEPDDLWEQYQYYLDIQTGRLIFAHNATRKGCSGFYAGSTWRDRAGKAERQILTIVLDTAGASVRLNGEVLKSDFSYSTIAIGGSIAIGSNYSGSGSHFNGKLAEIALYTSALSDADIERIEGHLAHKWLIGDKLAYDHTYTSARLPIPEYGSSGGPKYQAMIDKIASGHERREAVQSSVYKSFECRYDVQSLADLQQILAFFMAHYGRGYSFRYKDFSDYSATGETCSGSGTAWQLQKAYTSGSYSYTRTILKPVYGTVTLYDDGSEIDDSTYSIDYQTGAITLDSAASGTVTADFEFDCCVRFDTDELSQALHDYDFGSTAALPLVEVPG